MLKVLYVVLIFLVGFMSAYLVNFYFDANSYSLGGSARAPSDFVLSDEIEVYPDRVVIELENARLSRYAPTGSMVPVLDDYANGINVKPKSEEQINVGDIITFHDNGNLIVHRVVAKEVDENGIYFVTKGDNSFVSDGKIRFEDIEHKLVGLIY